MKMLLLGGWGMPASVLQPLRLALGISPELCWSLNRPLDELRQRIRTEIQPGTLLIGWSLGGNLAIELAAEAADRITAVVSIASNPRFLREENWPHAYDPDTFLSFSDALQDDPVATMQQFAALATLGSLYQREELRWLRGHLEPEHMFSPPVLQETLASLANMDQREALRGLTIPGVHLLGEQDALVPATVAEDLRALNKNAQVHLVPGMGHLPSFRFASEVAELVREAILPLIRSWC